MNGKMMPESHRPRRPLCDPCGLASLLVFYKMFVSEHAL